MHPTNDTYSITIYSSRLFFPIWFAVHTHIVTEHNGLTNRYDIFGRTLYPNEHSLKGYLYKNVLPPDTGLFILWAKNALTGIGPRWKTKKCGYLEGGQNSIAHSIYKFFEEGEMLNYPHIETYRMFKGPNSNTFTRWIIDQFPESKLKLPVSAWGRSSKKYL
jgi:hypothetical protein